jgi:hypothetical protein
MAPNISAETLEALGLQVPTPMGRSGPSHANGFIAVAVNFTATRTIGNMGDAPASGKPGNLRSCANYLLPAAKYQAKGVGPFDSHYTTVIWREVGNQLE